jgi:hypothetical protein
MNLETNILHKAIRINGIVISGFVEMFTNADDESAELFVDRRQGQTEWTSAEGANCILFVNLNCTILFVVMLSYLREKFHRFGP